MSKSKLVIVGQTKNGTSAVVSNKPEPEPFFTMEDGHKITELWYSTSSVTTAVMSREYQKEFSFNIPPAATRFIRSTIPPFSAVKLCEKKYGGNVSIDTFGMHNTTTIDFAVVTKGKPAFRRLNNQIFILK